MYVNYAHDGKILTYKKVPPLFTDIFQKLAYINANADRSTRYFPWGKCLLEVDAGIESIGVVVSIFPKRILDNDRRITPHTQLQENYSHPFMPPQKVLITALGMIPSLVLKKGE